MAEEPEVERFVRVMARFSIAGMVAHLSGKVGSGLGPELIAKMLHEEGLPPDTAAPLQSRALLNRAGRLRFKQLWDVEIRKAVNELPDEYRAQALDHFTAARAWRQIMY